MAMSRRGGRSRLTLILLVLSSITILTIDFRGGSGALEPVRDGAATVFSPVRGAADRVFSPVADAWNGAWHYDDVRKENEALRKENDVLRGNNAEGEAASKDAEQLRKSVGLASVSDIPQVLAQVSSGAVSNFAHTIELDHGSSDHVAVGNPVVTGAGLVGRVVQVTSGHSVVKLITDPDFAIGIRLTSSQEIGVARGTGEGGPLRVESGINPKADVPIGEAVTTSGLDRAIFPPLIPVGTARAAELSPDQLSKVVTIDPLADLARLAYVTVLLWEPTR
ncbi:MAG: rod shape-determining protein MreC [Acidimicrobiales bacterium]